MLARRESPVLAAVALQLGAKPAAPDESRIPVTTDPEFADLIAPFLDNCRRETAAMRKNLEIRDYPAIVAASHRLTGAGASYGFKPLSDRSRLIEAAAKAGDSAEISKHLEEMSCYLQRVSVIYS